MEAYLPTNNSPFFVCWEDRGQMSPFIYLPSNNNCSAGGRNIYLGIYKS